MQHMSSSTEEPVGAGADAGASRLVLGTAQLGQPYGIANQRGQPSHMETTAIFDLAVGAGVLGFDTAAGYGDAELRIGGYLRTHGLERQARVVTKLGASDVRDEIYLRAALDRSRARLGVVPAGVLLHDPSLLAQWRGPLGNWLRTCRTEGKMDALGVSVYRPEQFAAALALPGLELVQAPFSVFDRRVEQAGLLEEARRRSGVRVMLRSVFLQGLLLLEPSSCPPSLAFAAPLLRQWQDLCRRFEVAPAVAALRFALQRAASTTIVVGCESRIQLRELLAAAEAPPLSHGFLAELDELATSDADLIDPTRWRT
jgi:aryl-alcohol dehydrogenase-like predicted oxidoreductase